MKQKWTPCPFHYKRNPLISLIRERIILQLQLVTPGNVSIVVCKKCSISLLEAAMYMQFVFSCNTINLSNNIILV